ncbi:hypothetical protein VTN49DRAFT_3277 [Thermomyces lanuginosus]|uniref:uncharacterized protein n=1 Tax=Thermomyces lanuginosus TaxID=5541 RepID=UPI0037437E97
MASQEPLKILSFDGCGPGGLANLILLAKIMERIRVAKGLDYTPRPCECFDLIGGTSTGGIIAIMLGRLGMSVEECIEAYCLVAAETPVIQRKLMEHNGAWQVSSGRALEKAIRRAIGEWCPETECMLQIFCTMKACSFAINHAQRRWS